MKRFLVILFSFFSLVCCLPMDREIIYRFGNNSDHDIYFVFDFHPTDNVITKGSACYYVEHGSFFWYGTRGLKSSIKEDSLYVFIIDRDKADLGTDWRYFLSEDQISLIDDSAILERLTRTLSSNPFGYVYEPRKE